MTVTRGRWRRVGTATTTANGTTTISAANPKIDIGATEDAILEAHVMGDDSTGASSQYSRIRQFVYNGALIGSLDTKTVVSQGAASAIFQITSNELELVLTSSEFAMTWHWWINVVVRP